MTVEQFVNQQNDFGVYRGMEVLLHEGIYVITAPHVDTFIPVPGDTHLDIAREVFFQVHPLPETGAEKTQPEVETEKAEVETEKAEHKPEEKPFKFSGLTCEVGHTHVCEYVKIPLSEKTSLRYVIRFDDRKDHEGLWYLKVHGTKQWTSLEEEVAKKIFEATGGMEYQTIHGFTLKGQRYKTTHEHKKGSTIATTTIKE